MLKMLPTRKLNEKYFVNKINKFSFNFTYQSIFLNGFQGKKMHFVGLSNAFKNIFLYLKYIFKNIQKNKWPKT